MPSDIDLCEPALEHGIQHPLIDYRPVLAVTLVDLTVDGSVVVGVRTPAANLWHQNVLSVPTMRVPMALAQHWTSFLGAPDVPEDVGVLGWVKALAGLKLGLADPLELDAKSEAGVKLRVDRIDAWQGTSLIDYVDGQDKTETLTMFNALVVMERGAEHLPVTTASYAPLQWLTQDRYRHVVDTKDVSSLGSEYDAMEVCVRGLCIQTTTMMLDAVADSGTAS